MISKKNILNDILYEKNIPSFNTQYSQNGTTFLRRKRITNLPLNVLEAIFDAMPRKRNRISTMDELRRSLRKLKEEA